jgi:hypothetical protein
MLALDGVFEFCPNPWTACRCKILASSGGLLVGIAGRPMKRRRHLVADWAVRAHLIVLSTPSLAFLSPRLVEAEEPGGVPTPRSELAVQALDVRVLGRLARPG